jgi:branched-chain amino acid transport system ATP-binding protein
VILQVQGLTKRFDGLVAVNDLSFHVAEGEILALIGPNGAGKTTVFNLISGLLRQDAGRILFDGQDVTHWTPEERARRGIGRTFQVMQPFGELSVLENLLVGALYGRARMGSLRAAREDAEAIGHLVGLGPLLDRPAAGLGVADLKRLELARALAMHPRLLLLDEVLAGLTPTEAREAVEMIRRVRERGVTILLIDHVMHSVRALADRVVVMNFGQKLAEGTFDAVTSDPRVIEAYLGAEDGTG